MKPILTLLSAAALALSLSACGGGGSDGASAPAPAPQPSASLSEFDGTWALEPSLNTCLDEFPYTKDPHFYRVRDIVLKSAGAQVEATIAMEVFEDGACTTKTGLVSETFDWNPSARETTGRANVIGATPVFKQGVASRDGAAGPLVLNALPNGTLAGWKGIKLIADVQDNKLFLNFSDAGAALDAQGFPRDFLANFFFVKK